MGRNGRGRVNAVVWDWNRPLITIEGCLEVARELAETGDRPLNFKLACWAGITSINTKLAWNGRAVRRLARYVHDSLPDDFDGVAAIFRGTSFGMLGTHYDGIKGIERLAAEGKLPAVSQDSWTHDRWIAWRDEMVKLPGVGYKVASMIGLVCCPLTCPLVPVDMWVMRRLGLPGDKSPGNKGPYEAVERMVIAERDAAGYSHLPACVWHWYKWSQARQACVDARTGKSYETPAERPESHADLSPRDYPAA